MQSTLATAPDIGARDVRGAVASGIDSTHHAVRNGSFVSSRCTLHIPVIFFCDDINESNDEYRS